MTRAYLSFYSHMASYIFLLVQVLGNDFLYYGDLSYVHELSSFTKLVLENLVDSIQQEPSLVNMTIRLFYLALYFSQVTCREILPIRLFYLALSFLTKHADTDF